MTATMGDVLEELVQRVDALQQESSKVRAGVLSLWVRLAVESREKGNELRVTGQEAQERYGIGTMTLRRYLTLLEEAGLVELGYSAHGARTVKVASLNGK
jgi:response regulator of citrate/malate metabolism